MMLCINCKGDWVGPRADMHAMAKGKVTVTAWNPTPGVYVYRMRRKGTSTTEYGEARGSCMVGKKIPS